MRRTTGLALGLLLALAVAGCGGAGRHDGVATAGSPAATATGTAAPDGLTEQERALQFARCMRTNGVPNFPDPKVNGGGISIDVPEGTDRAKVDAAMQKCRKYLPNGGEPTKADPNVVAQLRKFSQCMREHGVPNFPDPTDSGLAVDNSKLGMDPNGATFKAAQQACNTYMPVPPSGQPGPGQNTAGIG
jgi:hypothetical protein